VAIGRHDENLVTQILTPSRAADDPPIDGVALTHHVLHKPIDYATIWLFFDPEEEPGDTRRFQVHVHHHYAPAPGRQVCSHHGCGRTSADAPFDSEEGESCGVIRGLCGYRSCDHPIAAAAEAVRKIHR
jgi:hypothetical protein